MAINALNRKHYDENSNSSVVLAFCLVVMAGWPGFSRSASLDAMLGAFMAEKANASTTMIFNGLSFLIDERHTICQETAAGKLVCQVNQGTEIIFEKISVTSPAALNLLRRNRKEHWNTLYAPLNQYVEETVKIMGKAIPLQSAIYFRFDNINWPVLIRSYDVVMDGKSAINVTSICDVRLWQASIELVENIERSLNKSAK